MHAPPPNAQDVVDGRYLLDAPLDAWGIGDPWRCRDKNFRNRPVVLKFLHGGAEQLGERTQELRAQRTLKHASLLPVINQGVWDGRPWVAFDYFEGSSLARMLVAERRTHGTLDTATAREVVGKVFDALAAAHEAAAPVLHGCLQPASVLVGAASVKVIDFGLLPFADDGVAAYRAPEVVRAADVSLASDVYSLGALLADALLPQGPGDPRRALEAFLAGLAREGVAAGRAQRPDLSPTLWDVIARAVKRDPATRWDDVGAMRVALDAAWAAAPIAPARARAATVPPVSSGRGSVAPAVPVALPTPAPPVPVAAFTGAMPAAPAFTAPPVMRPLTQAGLPAASMRAAPPVAPPSWDPPPSVPPSFPPSPPSGRVDPNAWSTLNPSQLASAQSALAAAWDAPSPFAAPPWKAPAPPAPPTPSVDPVAARLAAMPQESTAALDLDSLRAAVGATNESTMALDLGSLRASAPSSASAPRALRPSGDMGDWKDSVVVLNTGDGLSDTTLDGDDEPHEPGSRTHVSAAPGEVLDSMATLQPARRPGAVAAWLGATAVEHPVFDDDQDATNIASNPARTAPMGLTPRAPVPLSERTMAVDIPAASPVSPYATMPAPRVDVPAWGLPPSVARQPAPLQAPPPSKTPIALAVIVAIVLIVGAAIFVWMRAH